MSRDPVRTAPTPTSCRPQIPTLAKVEVLARERGHPWPPGGGRGGCQQGPTAPRPARGKRSPVREAPPPERPDPSRRKSRPLRAPLRSSARASASGSKLCSGDGSHRPGPSAGPSVSPGLSNHRDAPAEPALPSVTPTPKLSNPSLTLLGEVEQSRGRGLGAETRLSDRDLRRVN